MHLRPPEGGRCGLAPVEPCQGPDADPDVLFHMPPSSAHLHRMSRMNAPKRGATLLVSPRKPSRKPGE